MLKLRSATIADLALLQKWDKDPGVLASDPNDDWQWEFELDRCLPWREQLIAQVDNIPIGCLQIIDPLLEESHYWGKVEPNLRAIDIWIGEPEYRGKGYGTQMMTLAIDRCFEDKFVTAILIDPLSNNLRAIAFYEKLGFTRVGEQQFGADSCIVYRLERNLWMTKN